MTSSNIDLNGHQTNALSLYDMVHNGHLTDDQRVELAIALKRAKVSQTGLSWSIAQAAYDHYQTGKVSEYQGKISMKMAGEIMNVVNSSKAAMGYHAQSVRIIASITTEWVKRAYQSAQMINSQGGTSSNGVSLGIQKDVLKNNLRNVYIKNQNAMNTGYWIFVENNLSSLSPSKYFFQSAGSALFTGELTIRGVQEVLESLKGLIPVYLQYQAQLLKASGPVRNIMLKKQGGRS